MKQRPAAPPGFFQQLARRIELHPRLTLVLLTLAAFGPFLAKPLNMDDPLFLWAAKHIQSHPANPYDFTVNWYGTPMPMWEITKNPPLSCYYLALAAKIIGWSEIALHAAFLLPAIAVILGTYRLARQFCDRPIFAAATTIFMPVFLVSGTSLMCDVPMLAFWMWAVVLWVEGLAKQDFRRLIGSALLMTLAAYTKYFGICLVPLLAAYGFTRQRRMGWWAACLLIPIAGMIAYQWATFHLYGKGLFADAAGFATHEHRFEISQLPASGLTGLAFTGGCAAAATLFAPWLWRKLTLGMFCLGTAFVAGMSFTEPSWWDKYHLLRGTTHAWLGAQVIFWGIGGVSVLAMAVADAWQRRDTASYLLAAWIWGTFIFAGFLNWTVNGRSILPMAPAVAILLARRLTPNLRKNKKAAPQAGPYALGICSVLAATIGLLVAGADYHFGQTARRCAQETCAKYGHGPGTVWFLGHWGWQYYMEAPGAKPLVSGQTTPPMGDLIAVTFNNSNVGWPNSKTSHLREIIPMAGREWLATENSLLGAGFYSSVFGPLSFAFGNAPPEKIYVFEIGPALESAPQP